MIQTDELRICLNIWLYTYTPMRTQLSYVLDITQVKKYKSILQTQ